MSALCRHVKNELVAYGVNMVDKDLLTNVRKLIHYLDWTLLKTEKEDE